MKTIRISTAIIGFLLLVSCTANYKYLNDVHSYHLNPRGSYLKINTRVTDSLGRKLPVIHYKGELICVDSINLYLLNQLDTGTFLSTVRLKEVQDFTLKYAREKEVGWTVPLYSLVTLSHGWFLVFTFPINLITTAGITINSKKDYRLSSTDTNIGELYKYARFPQGLPDGIDIQTIK